MSNDGSKRISSAKARKKPRTLVPVKLGFIDAMNGKPYSPEYETALKWWQQNYSHGRLIAMELKAKGAKVKWPDNIIMPKVIEHTCSSVAYEMLPAAAQ